ADDQEQRVLEASLNKALEEAWTKANAVLEDATRGLEGSAKKIWLAAEAAEYSSLLYSLTYGLEDMDPAPPEMKGKDTLSLVKESVAALSQVRTSNKRKQEQTYSTLRNAVHGLRTAYLNSLKNAERSR
ncbi:MAG TPA: hypothetical protein VIH83_02680, partial [Candidatus Bathyarchaeia archaeon]